MQSASMTISDSFLKLFKAVAYHTWRAMTGRPQYIHQHDSRVGMQLALASLALTTAAVVCVKFSGEYVLGVMYLLWPLNAVMYCLTLRDVAIEHASKLYVMNALHALSGWNVVDLLLVGLLAIFFSSGEQHSRATLEFVLNLGTFSLRARVLLKNLRLFRALPPDIRKSGYNPSERTSL